MNLPDKDDPIRIYLTDSFPSATQLVWKEELVTPKQYGMKLKKKRNKKNRLKKRYKKIKRRTAPRTKYTIKK